MLALRSQIKTLENNFEKTVRDFNEVQLQFRLADESRYSNRSEISETAKLLRESNLNCVYCPSNIKYIINH